LIAPIERLVSIADHFSTSRARIGAPLYAACSASYNMEAGLVRASQRWIGCGVLSTIGCHK
jgi:hypothetical protein